MMYDDGFFYILNEVKSRFERKSMDYAQGDDPFFNFHVAANAIGASPWSVAILYATKHIARMFKWLRDGYTPNMDEALEVFGDIITYLAIAYELVGEENDQADDEDVEDEEGSSNSWYSSASVY